MLDGRKAKAKEQGFESMKRCNRKDNETAVALCSLGHGASRERNKKGTRTTLPIHYVTCNITFYPQHLYSMIHYGTALADQTSQKPSLSLQDAQ